MSRRGRKGKDTASKPSILQYLAADSAPSTFAIVKPIVDGVVNLVIDAS